MSDFAVSTTFNAKDKVSSKFRRMGKSADKFSNRTSKAFKRASKSATSFGTITKGILAAGAVQRGLGLVTSGVTGAIAEFIAFDDAIVAAGARFKDMVIGSKEYNAQLKAIKKSSREAAKVSPFTPAQTAKGLDFLARAGFKSTVAMGSLQGMINLALATGEDFARVADISSDLLGAFGMNSENAAQKVKNLNKLNNVLAKTTNSANVTMEDLFDTMKAVGPVATGVLGASLEEVAALTGVLGNSGIKGSLAMTALKNAYLRLAAPTGAGAAILKKLNITLDDGTGNAKKMTDLMAELGAELEGVGQVKQAEILDAIFGKRAIAGGKNLIDNIKNIKTLNKELDNAAGFNQKVADVMKRSLGNQIKSLQSALFELTFKGFTSFEKGGKSAIEGLTDAINKFDPTPIIDGLHTILKVIKVIWSFAKGLFTVLTPVMAFWVTYKAALLGAWAAQKLLTGVTLVYAALGSGSIFTAMASGVLLAARAVGLLTAALIANPIGATIALVIALGAAVFVVVENWDAITESISQAINAVKEFTGLSGIETGSPGAAPGSPKPAPGATSSSTAAPAPERRAPNEQEAQARQKGAFSGRIEVLAPEETKTSFVSDFMDIFVNTKNNGTQ